MKSTGTTPDLNIIYEDKQVLLIDKPHNVLSQQDHTGDPDVLTLCKQYLAKANDKASPPFLGLIHRLDRPVGGLMLLAKTSHAAQVLSKQINDRLMQKTYWTVTFGEPPQNGVLSDYLLKDRNTNIVEVVSPDNRKAKKAVLSFAKLEKKDGLNLLSIHLQTGRPHQIRVQLAAKKWGIWGDYKYGPQNQPDGRTMALRAVELNFKHPTNGEQLHFELPPPSVEPWNRFQH
jgi:23S rRNA pseudouridine1911/1915/1917 synthase